MKQTLIIGLLAVSAMAMAQAPEQKADSAKQDSGFVFTVDKEVPITSVKDQNRSGTCWCFSTIGFLESEVLRTQKKTMDLSEMFVVSHTMVDRAEYVVRMYQSAQFSAGGSAYDVIYCLKHYGMVPQEAMPGIKYAWHPEKDTLPVHAELDAVAGGYVRALKKPLSPVWKQGLQAVYDTYLGKCPETFTYEGKEYTPRTFADNVLKLNADDYVSITSYTYHPFSYEEGHPRFAFEVPDNWRMDQMYNVPIEDLMRIIDNAIEKGYTMAWGADVSEDGFTRNGIAVCPDVDRGADLTGSDMAHWLGLSASQKKEELTKRPLPEIEVTQQMRQDALDSQETTDDHGMQIFGTAHDQNGKKYYMIKNSWGSKRYEKTYKGIWYVSETFMKYKTNDILVHKDAIPKDIRKKLGL